VKRLLLWDIDGTLILGGGVGSSALYEAVATAVGRPISGVVAMHGKTDQQIFTEMLLGAGVTDEDFPDMLTVAMLEAERIMARSEADLRQRGELTSGVTTALGRLALIPDVRQTLVTGNLAGNAAVKLAAFDLTDYFDLEIGAYGTDHADRNELVPIALERVARLRGEHYQPEDVWVIGDTPNDLACARAAGVRCLLVATGQIPLTDLRALDAEVVLADLSDTDRVVQILAE